MAQESGKSTGPRASKIRPVRLMRERLIGDFLKELNYVATEAARMAPQGSAVANNASRTSLALINSCSKIGSPIDLDQAEGILLKIQDSLCSKSKTVTDLVVSDIPEAAKALALVHMFDGNLRAAIRTGENFGVSGFLNEIREKAASLNCSMGREGIGQDLYLREFEITYSPTGPVVATKRHYIDGLMGSLLRQLD